MVREGRAGTVGLKARELPEGEAAERQRRLKDSSDIHLMLQCLSLVWTVSGGGGEVDLCKYTHRYTHEHHTYAH